MTNIADKLGYPSKMIKLLSVLELLSRGKYLIWNSASTWNRWIYMRMKYFGKCYINCQNTHYIELMTHNSHKYGTHELIIQLQMGLRVIYFDEFIRTVF